LEQEINSKRKESSNDDFFTFKLVKIFWL